MRNRIVNVINTYRELSPFRRLAISPFRPFLLCALLLLAASAWAKPPAAPPKEPVASPPVPAANTGVEPASEPKWQNDKADLCFDLDITGGPSDPVAGIIAVIPDGGILPRPRFKAEVTTPGGKILKSELIWHNPREGAAIVFEPPSDTATVQLYVLPSNDTPKPLSQFRPSIVVFGKNVATSSLDAARSMAASPLIADDVLFGTADQIFATTASVVRDANSASYFLGWFKPQTAGKAYLFTISKDGSEFSVDGNPVHSWPGLHDRSGGANAEHGNWVNLTAGMHKIEYFQFCAHPKGFEAYFGVQWPGAKQVDNPKFPGKKNKEVTREMQASDFVHSGKTKLTGVRSKKEPAAVIDSSFAAYICPSNAPICLFDFSVLGGETHPQGTGVEWDFGNGRKVQGPKTAWLSVGSANLTVTLTVSNTAPVSRASKTVFPKKWPELTSVTNAAGRARFSAAFDVMVRSTPKDKPPCENWPPVLWGALLSVLDRGQYDELLRSIFERSREDIRALPLAERYALEDLFIATLRMSTNTAAVTKWMDELERGEKDLARLLQLKSDRIDFYLWDANRPEAAESLAGQLSASSLGTLQYSIGMIRLGDSRLLAGRLEDARRYYGLAQQNSPNIRKLIRQPASPATDAPSKTAGTTNKPDLMSRTAYPLDARKDDKHDPMSRTAYPLDAKKPGADDKGKKSAPAAPSLSRGLFAVRADDWKVSAVHEASYYATVKTLLNQRYPQEARQVLAQWELEFPLQKLAGDYPIAEASYYMAVGHYARAQRILQIYRSAVDLTNVLPDAMKMELDCLKHLHKDAEIKALAQVILKRLPNHPLAKVAEGILNAAKGGPALTEGDWSDQKNNESLNIKFDKKTGNILDMLGKDVVIDAPARPAKAPKNTEKQP